MRPVTISSKYRITIPREIRERFGIKPGQKVAFIPHENSLQMVVVSSIQDVRRSLKEGDLNVKCEDEHEEHPHTESGLG
jgi:AbrB family looped-hinge helix DNA binding protein